MIHYPSRTRLFAAGCAALAGYVDAIAFVLLGGFFVSFMSGNTTRMAVGGAYATAAFGIAAALIAAFVAGVTAGSLLARRLRQPLRGRLLLAVVAGVLSLAVLAERAGGVLAGGALMAFAMGAVNAVLEEGGEVRVGLTYMTGALVRVGQRLAAALSGGPRWAFAPYLLLWAGLAVGAIGGALAFRALGLAALWPAVAGALGLAALSPERD